MVENRKLFYAISLMLLTCCQIITMLPHNAASSESITEQNSNENNKNNNKIELKDNNSSGSDSYNNINNGSNYYNNSNNNNNDNRDFLIIATGENSDHQKTVNGVGVWEEQENDARPADNIDDLIFLDKRPINQQQHYHHHHHDHHGPQEKQLLVHQQQHDHYQHKNSQETEHSQYEFHHITMDAGNSNSNSNEDTNSMVDTTYSTMIVVDEDNAEEEEHAGGDGVPHEIELQPDINEEVITLNVTPLDLSDFLSLIPAAKVKAIVNHYYHNDPEVQLAHAFMSSRDFLMLKQHIVAIPEMSAFLRYLNNSGLDLVQFVTALTNLTAYKNEKEEEKGKFSSSLHSTTLVNEKAEEQENGTTTITTTTIAEMSDVEYVKKQSATIAPPTISNIQMQRTATLPATTSTTLITTTTKIDDLNETTIKTATTTAKEQLNGLHGLVDSILDVLPQDQILATFFDKLEANEQFSKLVDNIGSPEFAKILNNMQNSIPLRNLIFTLHNNGIYVIRIVDSLKSYFFLGGF